MWVTVVRGNAEIDLELEHVQQASVAQLAQACGLPAGGLIIDGKSWPAAAAVRDVRLASGARLEAQLRDHGALALARNPVAILRHVGGWAASGSLALDAGDYGVAGRERIGLGAESIEDPDFYVRVTADGARVKPGEGRYVFADKRPAAAVSNARDSLIVTGGSAFAFAEPPDHVPPTGPMLWNRPPRLAPAEPETDVELPMRPRPVPGRQALSWAMLLAPIPIGIVMAFLWSPIFALFILMSPIMMLGQWAEGRSTERKERRRFGREFADVMQTVRAEVANATDREQLRRRRHRPDVADLRTWASGADPRLWERRRSHDDFLVLSGGYADQPLELTAAGPGAGDFAEAKQVLENSATVADAPVDIDLLVDRSVAVVGPRSLALAQARSLVLQATTLHGPADLELAVMADSDRLADWDFTKWLPHLRTLGGGMRIATTIDQIDPLLPEPDDEPSILASNEEPTGPALFCIVDSLAMAVAAGSPLRAAMAELQGVVHGIIVAEHAEHVPASCGCIIEIDRTGAVTVRRPAAGVETAPVIPAGLAAGDAVEWARSLARYHDPDAAGASTGIAGALTLTDLTGVPDAGEIVERWKRLETDPTPRGAIGVTDAGPLIVDLAEDGPHGLVAGTTGSGKSELLRTMVASMAWEVDPDHLNFVLIDFKGGGAFDVCADLPHVVSVVTDLDEHLAERALRCLKAELRLREELLRDHAATDLGEYLEGGGDRLPRLVVIIDEFATLAVELPDFLDSLVDIAQRGRSLGVHMILATQRPSGVLDNKVRANTNLRIALRVQDDGDSDDVIGTTQAARLSRQQPGRAFARFGQSEITEFQTALVTGTHVPAEERNIAVRPFSILPGQTDDAAAQPNTVATTEPPTTDIELIVAAVRDAFDAGGYDEPRIPWPDPLPEHIDVASLELDEHQRELHGHFATPIGVMDLPDRQRQEAVAWSPTVGNSILYGINAADVTNTMTTIALGLARSHSPGALHLYGLEYGTNTLAPLVDLPHCGDIVDGTDLERTMRLIGLLNAEIARRRDQMASGATTTALTLFMVDNYAGLTEMLEEAGEFDAMSHAAQIVRDGPAVGIFSLLGAQSERGVPLRLANLVEHKLLFRLVDPNSYSAFGLRPKDIPALGPGRFIDPEIRELVQAAHVRGELADSVAEIAARSAQHPVDPTRRPAPVEVLRDHYDNSVIDWHQGFADSERLVLPLGIDAASLGTASLPLAATEHGLIVGGSGSGKSTTLVALALAARSLDPTLPIVGVAHRRSPLRECPALDSLVGRTTSTERLRELVDRDRALILIDDAGALSEAHAEVLAEVAGAMVDGRHMVATCRADYPKEFDSWVGPLRRNQSGIALQPNPTDGDALRTMLPMHRPERFPVGRGFLVANGVPELVQLALPAAYDPVPRPEDTDSGLGIPRVEVQQSGAETPGARIDLGLNRFTTDPDALANEASADDAADGRIDLGLGSFDTAPQTDGE